MSDKRERLADIDEEILCADDLDDALIGYVEQFGRPPIALYDMERVMELYMIRDGMSYEDAMDHFQYNVIGGYVGEYTPAFATLFQEDDE